MFADLTGGGIAIAHNGNLTNARTLRDRTGRAKGAIFQSTSDTEVIIHLAARSIYSPIVDKLIDALKQVEGAYSLVALTSKKLIGVRDPWGVRPLVLGKLDGAQILASETCALDIIGAEFVRDVEPGEMVVITKDGIESYHPVRQAAAAASASSNTSISRARIRSSKAATSTKCASASARNWRAKRRPRPTWSIPVPDSGVPAASAMPTSRGLPFELGIIRNHYVGRTFIEPTDGIRHLGVRLKHNPNRAMLDGQARRAGRRFHRARHDVEEDRADGARRRRDRSAFPHRQPADHAFLLLRRRHAEHGRSARAHAWTSRTCAGCIGADSLAFVSMDGLYRAMGEAKRNARRAAILRRLLLRRLSDRADRHQRRPQGRPALAPRRSRVIA